MKSNIRARLVIHGIGEMDKKEYTFFKKWLKMIYEEFMKEDREIFNQKRFRHTLYKP